MNFTKPALYGISLSFLLGLFLSMPASAQKKRASIKGSVLDSTQAKPLPFATVGLYKVADHTRPLQNIFSDSKGRYEFLKVDTGQYVVYASNSGYAEKATSPFFITNDSTALELPALTLSTVAQDLAAVTVSARRPLIEQSEDKLIYNAESDPSTQGETAIDVLRKTPFLSVDGEGNVQLNGQTNFKVLLNGKETAMFTKNLKEALQSFPANLIKKVEVITSPSSKYDAEGVGGIINIITKKKVMGYNGSLGISRNFTNFRNSINGNLSFKYGKFGLSASYGYNVTDSYKMRLESETESLVPVVFSKRYSNGERKIGNHYQYLNMELSLDIDSLNTLSVSGNLSDWAGRNTNYRDFGVISADKRDTLFNVFDERGKGIFPSFNIGVDYIRKFRKPEQELAFKFYHEPSKDNYTQWSDQYYPTFTRYSINQNNNTMRQTTWQTDYVQPLTKYTRLEIGGKVILRQADANYESQLRYGADEKFRIDSSNSDKFNYSQNVYSLYLTYRFNWKKFSFRLGNRVERTVVEGNFIKSHTEVRQDYYTWIPSVYTSLKWNTVNTLSLSYTRRINRPYIWDLNPFVFNTDSLNISYGNPGLVPELSHVFELAYTVVKGKTNINVRLSESFSNTQIARYFLFNNNTGIISNTLDNIGSYASTGLSGNLTVPINSKWRINTNLGLRYDFLKNRLNAAQKNQGFGGWMSFNSNYDIDKKWTVFANGYFLWPSVRIQGRGSNGSWYGMGANYKFFKEKFTLSVALNNFLAKDQIWKNYSKDANFNTVYKIFAPSRGINLSLRWNFGKLTENVSRKRGVNNDDLRSGGNNN